MCRVYFEFAASSERVCVRPPFLSFRTRPMRRMRNLNNMYARERGDPILRYSVRPCCHRTKKMHKTIFPACCFPVWPADGQCELPLPGILAAHLQLSRAHSIIHVCTHMCVPCLYAIYDECTTIYGHKNCLSYWQASWLPFAIYFALCCQGFCAQTQVHLPSRSHCSPLCLAHTCALPVAAYSGVQLANATPAPTAAAAHDKSLFIISLVIEQFPLVVPWIFPSTRKLLPKWQSQQNPHKLNWQLTGHFHA